MAVRRREFLVGAAGACGAAIAVRAETAQTSPVPDKGPPHEIEGAESRFVDNDGVKLHCACVGAGEPVILLHGWPQTSLAWSGVMRRLSGERRLIAVDLRGAGRSDRPQGGYDKKTIAGDVAAVIDVLCGGRAAVVGHDMGGKAAYVLGLISPGRISHLALVDCAPPGTENADALHGGAWHYGFHMARDIPEMLTAGRERDYIAAQIRAWSHVKEAIGEAAIAEYARSHSSPGGMTAGFELYRALPQDAAFVASLKDVRFEMPVLTVAGAQSVGRRLGDAVAPQAPRHRAVIVEDCGHFVPEEATERLSEELRGFLAT